MRNMGTKEKERFDYLKEVNTKVAALEIMHDNIIRLGDDDVYDSWVAYGVPDEATKDDLYEIATNDKEYKSIEVYYNRIMNNQESFVHYDSYTKVVSFRI